ncbi:MAG TPA: hypothetical protein DF383_06025 [Deltaproteobacteria bacterium]|nr:hypothetical protein [Deltaproteobacteria bacterium]
MLLEKITVGPFQCNCSILACPQRREAAVIDPGAEAERIVAVLKSRGWKPKYLIHTHAHLDHVGATEELQRELGGEVGLHREDNFLYENVAMQAALFNLPGFTVPPVQQWLEDGDVLKFGQECLEVFHTPGHTPGSLSFYVETEAGPQIFTGDTLFLGSVGRTDLWGGDFELLMKSIRNKLLGLGDATIVHPGHGPETSIGEEKRRNPFIQRL